MSHEATVSTPSLRLLITNEECATVLHCQGNLTLENSEFLKAEVKSRIPDNGRLVLDLSGVSRMDSSGLGAVVGLFLHGKTKNCELELINLNEQIRKLLGITNLLSFFKLGEL